MKESINQEANSSIPTGPELVEQLRPRRTASKSIQIKKIPSQSRGMTQNDWLFSRHSFSFGNYYDLNRLGFGTLRVLNEDRVQGGKGFGKHEHENMEIITIVLEGALKHEDSLGNQGTIQPLHVQRMTAGKGIIHSEWNAREDESVHFLQIWIFPKQRNLLPNYEQKSFSLEQFKNQLFPIVSGSQNPTSVSLNQEADIYLSHLDSNLELNHTLKSKKRGVYFFVIKGEIDLEGQFLQKGDAATIRETEGFHFRAKKESEILLIEVDGLYSL